MGSISGTLVNNGDVSAAFAVDPGNKVTLWLSGVFSGRVILQKSFDAASWFVADMKDFHQNGRNEASFIACYNSAMFYQHGGVVFCYGEDEPGLFYRLKYAPTSEYGGPAGSVTYRISQ